MTISTYNDFLQAVHGALWIWADRHHPLDLDGGKREGRPPVLSRHHAAKNILIPSDETSADEIRAAIPERRRHRWFRSLKSSQALTQSVFGAICTFDRLDLLEDVTTECGRPAFFEDREGWALEFEHEVRSLGEPRPTSVDVLLSAAQKRVAVECKFTESEFGTCSRPRLRPRDKTWPDQYCNGSYQVQLRRCNRCALAEIGIRYWDHLPHLFTWPADRDHEPCPFGSVYQLARNALAAVLTPDGELDPSTGHALVVYDARNPAYQFGGRADRRWALAIRACRVPGLVRRVTWQRVLAAVARAQELDYLVEAIEMKYGITPG